MLKRRPINPRNCTLIELAYARTGSMLKAARVVAFVTSWDVVRRELGRRPTVAEYSEYWRESERTAWRHLALFREVFDRDEVTPDDVLDLVADERASLNAPSDWSLAVVV